MELIQMVTGIALVFLAAALLFLLVFYASLHAGILDSGIRVVIPAVAAIVASNYLLALRRNEYADYKSCQEKGNDSHHHLPLGKLFILYIGNYLVPLLTCFLTFTHRTSLSFLYRLFGVYCGSTLLHKPSILLIIVLHFWIFCKEIAVFFFPPLAILGYNNVS